MANDGAVSRGGRRARPAPSGGGRAIYLYCVVRSTRSPSTVGAPRGLPGTTKLRVLSAGGGLWLVAADAPLSRYDADAIHRGLKGRDWVGRCAFAHERVIEHFSTTATALPMRLFTLFTTEDRALAHIARTRVRLERELEKVSGRREWGVRLSIDAASARNRARERARRGISASAAGTRFLMIKRAEQAAVSRLNADSRALALRFFDVLRSHADDARTRPPLAASGQRHLVLDAAFLVREGKTGAFQSAVRRESARLESEGYTVALTGPWPPYNFVGGKP